MDKMKKFTKGKHLWFRTIGSSIVGYIFDTVPFVLIAFVGVLTTRDILLMILSQYIIKIAIEALFGTPMAYALIAFLKKKDWNLLAKGQSIAKKFSAFLCVSARGFHRQKRKQGMHPKAHPLFCKYLICKITCEPSLRNLHWCSQRVPPYRQRPSQ